MTFLEKLEALLAREHLNRRTLSLKTGIPYTTIDNWYKRSYEGLKLSTAGKLASFFGTTTDYFLREELTPEHAALSVIRPLDEAAEGPVPTELS